MSHPAHVEGFENIYIYKTEAEPVIDPSFGENFGVMQILEPKHHYYLHSVPEQYLTIQAVRAYLFFCVLIDLRSCFISVHVCSFAVFSLSLFLSFFLSFFLFDCLFVFVLFCFVCLFFVMFFF